MKNRELIKYCDYCDGEYTAQRANSKYCCASCRQMASKSRLLGGLGYRQNLNSLPRNERFAPLQETKPKSAANYVSTQSSVDQNNHQPIVNKPSKNEGKSITIHQPIVNEAVEKIKMEIEKMKYEAELRKTVEAEFMESEKKRLVNELQKLLTLNKDKKTHLSRLRFIANAISDILRTRRAIFSDNPDDYNFVYSELIPKMKDYIREKKREREVVFEFVISEELVEKIEVIINNLNSY